MSDAIDSCTFSEASVSSLCSLNLLAGNRIHSLHFLLELVHARAARKQRRVGEKAAAARVETLLVGLVWTITRIIAAARLIPRSHLSR